MSMDGRTDPIAPNQRERLLLWLGCLALLAVKLVLLAIFGPQQETDSSSYIGYRDLILSDPDWWARNEASLTGNGPPFTYVPGYPLFLAATRVLFGSADLHAVAVMQSCLSVLVTYQVYLLARLWLDHAGLAAVAAVGYAGSLALIYDQSILTDSLFNSAFALAGCLLGLAILRGQRVTLGRALTIGVLVMIACSVRPIGLYLTLLFVPLAVMWFLRGRERSVARAVTLLCVLAPSLAFAAGMFTWNHYRSDGRLVYTTGAHIVTLQSVVNAASRGHDMFDGDTLVDRTARETLQSHSLREVARIATKLLEQTGRNKFEATALQSDKFFSAWVDHPWPMIENTIENYNEDLVHNVFNVIDNTLWYIRLATGERAWDGHTRTWERMGNDFRFGDLAMFVSVSLLRPVAWICWAAFLIGGPVLVIRALRGRGGLEDPRLLALIGFWLLFFGYTIGLCMVHYVARFTPAVLPGALVGSLFVLSLVMAGWRERRARPATG